MRIQHNIASLNAYRNFNNNTSTVNKNLEKLSSGYRINRAGDDAAGLAISEKMRAEITSLKVQQQNAKDGIGLIQTAEGALTEVHSMLNRMVELSEKHSNSLYDTSTDKAALNAEFNALQAEINRISTAAKYNGTSLLNGDLDGLSLAIGGSMQLDVSGTISTSGLSISGTTLSSVTTSTIKDAINTVSNFRAKLGGYQNRLEHTIANLSVMHENMTSAESSLRDTDVAEEMMAYTKNNIMIQSAQAMLAQANQQPQGVLQLLQ